MRKLRIFALAVLAWQVPWSIHAKTLPSPPVVNNSTGAVSILLSSERIWQEWLMANYPLQGVISQDQEKILQKLMAAGKWEMRFIGDIFKDGTPGVLLMKFSPSKKTLIRFAVLRWSQGRWRSLLRCEHKGLFDAKGAPITPTEPVDVYEIHLQQDPSGLSFFITRGKLGDDFFGDSVDLYYDNHKMTYFWPIDDPE